jgi:phage I-like protein
LRRPKTLTALTLSDEPPKEFRIWGFGTIDTLKGQFHFTEEDAARVMAAYADYGNELSFDYCHQAILSEGDAPAAGWFNLDLRDDGLWATNVRWTPLADERIRNKEYRYVSPAFLDDVHGHIYELVNIALTNLPATKNLEPLVAASRAVDRRSPAVALAISFQEVCQAVAEAIEKRFNYSAWLMDVYDDRAVFKYDGRFWQIGFRMDGPVAVLDGDALEVQRDYTPVQTTSREGETPMKSLLKALGLNENATEAEALVALQALQGNQQQLVTLTGKPTFAEALGVIQAHKAASEQVATLSARVAELEAQQVDAEVAALIAAGQAEGKVSPAMVESLTAMGKKDATTLKAFLEATPKIAPDYNHQQPKKPAGGTVTLSAEDLQVCKLMGIKPEDYQAHIAKQSS